MKLLVRLAMAFSLFAVLVGTLVIRISDARADIPPYVKGTVVSVSCTRWQAQAKGYTPTATKHYDLTVTDSFDKVLVHKSGDFTTGFAKLSGALNPTASYAYIVYLKISGYAPEQYQSRDSAVDCPYKAPTKAAASSPAFTPYDVIVYWQTDSLTGSIWPQHRLDSLPAPTCIPVRIQKDKYRIKSQADKDYLTGLKVLTINKEDSRFYVEGSVFTQGGSKYCTTAPPTDEPTPPVTTPPGTPTTTPATTPPVTTPAASTTPATTTPATPTTATASITTALAIRRNAARTTSVVVTTPDSVPVATQLASTGPKGASDSASVGFAVIIVGGVACLLGRRRNRTGIEPNKHR